VTENTTNDPQPAVWVDGDPLMEAIAAAVWEQCRTEHPSSAVDDPRNIAAVAASVARAAVSAVRPPATDRTALRDRIRRVLCERDGQAALWGTDMLEPDEYGEIADAVLAVLPEQADRAAVLRDFLSELDERLLGCCEECNACAAIARDLAAELAAGCPQCGDAGACNGGPCPLTAEPAAAGPDQTDETPVVCEGFQWIGQSFAICDRCGQPAWDHAGQDVAVEGAGPFDNRRTVRPWGPGEADAIRAKWGTPSADVPAVGGAQQPKET